MHLLLSKHRPNIHEAQFPYCSFTNSTGPAMPGPDPLQAHKHGAIMSCLGCNSFRGSSETHGGPTLQPPQTENKEAEQTACVGTTSQVTGFVTRITHSCSTSQACPMASPSPSTPQVDVITFGGSGKKPPQLLLRGHDPLNQQPSLPRPKEEPGKKKMPCHPQANVVFQHLRLHKP